MDWSDYQVEGQISIFDLLQTENDEFNPLEALAITIYHFEYPTRIDDKGIEWSILDKKRATIKPMKFALCHLDSIGKLYFLTKEEAEQALAEMKEV